MAKKLIKKTAAAEPQNQAPAATAAPFPGTRCESQFALIPLERIVPTSDNTRALPRDRMTVLSWWFQAGCPDDDSAAAQLVASSDRIRQLIELAHSVARVGVVEPAVVRILDPVSDDPTFDLRAGERRYWASFIAGLKELPCLVRAMTAAEAMEITVLENMLREDLDPLEEGQSVQAMLGVGWERAAIAAHIGKSAAWVARRAALAQLHPDWVGLYYDPESGAAKKLSAGHLELIARLPQDMQAALLERLGNTLANDWVRLTLEDLGDQIDVHLMKLSAAPWDLSEPVSETAGPCTVCPHNSAAQTDLFADLGTDGRCLHKPCWDRKLALYIGRMEQENPGILKASTRAAAQGMPAGTIYQYDDFYPNPTTGFRKAQALMLDGSKAGQIVDVWLQKGSKAATANQGGSADGATTLAEKRAALEARRIARAIDEVNERLLAEDSRPQSILDQPTELGMYGELTRIALVFGFAGIGTFRAQWDQYQSLAGEDDDQALILAVWKQLQRPISGSLTYNQVGEAPKLQEAARHVCELLGLSWAEILTRKVAENPEPKSWDKESE